MRSKALIVTLILIYLNATVESIKTYEEKNVGKELITDVYYKGSKLTANKNPCKEQQCVSKCCPYETFYYPAKKLCSNVTQTFGLPLHDKYMRLQEHNAVDVFHFKINQPVCGQGEVKFRILQFAKRKHQEFRLVTDGYLYVDDPTNIPPWVRIGPDKFCIDNFVTINNDGTNTTEVDALVCYSPDSKNSHYMLSSICMLISCVFILATVFVYTWLPQLHNIHGRVLIVYLICLFVGFIFMATMQLLLHTKKMTPEGCLFMTFVIYFSLLSAFFWLNVMCYDIWRVFGSKRELRREKHLIRSKLRAYALYAFSIPTLLTVLLISLEFSGMPPRPWMPVIRYQGCFLSGNSKLLYLYGPIVCLCVANMTLFILTMLRIVKANKESTVLNSGDSTRHDNRNSDKQRLFLYVKLFIVMGVSWLLEVIGAVYTSEHWQYADVYNVLIGLNIFIIFVCRRKIIKQLKERYKALRHGQVPQCTASRFRHTSRRDEMTTAQ